MRLVVSTLEAVWAVSSQPILMVRAIPAALLMGMFKMVGGGKFSDKMSDVTASLFLLYLDFKVIDWHPYFFAGWILSASLADQAQKRWRKEAGLPTEVSDYCEALGCLNVKHPGSRYCAAHTRETR